MNKKEKQVKQSLINAVNSVKKKFRALHNARTGQELENIEKFKPVTGKLDTLINMNEVNRNGNLQNSDDHGAAARQHSSPDWEWENAGRVSLQSTHYDDMVGDDDDGDVERSQLTSSTKSTKKKKLVVSMNHTKC